MLETNETVKIYQDETLGEFKLNSQEFIKNLSRVELIENLKASLWQCSVQVAITGGKLKIVKERVYPLGTNKVEVEFLESYLHSLIVWGNNANGWLLELEVIL